MRRILIAFFIFIFFYLHFQQFFKTIPIRYWDEHAWVGKSILLDLYTSKMNPIWRSYDQPPVIGYANRLVLNKGYEMYKYKNETFEAFLLRHNFSIINPNTMPLNWGRDPIRVFDISPSGLVEQFGDQIKKTIAIIFIVRKYNAIFYALHISMLFLLTQLLSGSILIGIVTAVLLGMSEALTKYSLMAQSETIFLALFNLNIIVFLAFRKKSSFTWIFVLSILGSLLFQAKINGFMIGLFILIYFLWKRQWQKGIFFISLFLLFSILINPTLMHFDFLWRIYQYFDIRRSIAIEQANSDTVSHIKNIYQAFLLFFNHYFFGKSRTYFNIIFSDGRIYFLLFFSFLVGIANQWRRQRIAVILFLYLLISTLIYLRVDWDRYWLHLTFFVYYFELYGFFSIVKFLFHYTKIFTTLLLSRKG